MKTKLPWAIALLFVLLATYCMWIVKTMPCCRRHSAAQTSSSTSASIVKVQWCLLCACGCNLCEETCTGPGGHGCKAKAGPNNGATKRDPNCPLARKAGKKS